MMIFYTYGQQTPANIRHVYTQLYTDWIHILIGAFFVYCTMGEHAEKLAVMQAQDQTRNPAAVRQQHYPLHHRTNHVKYFMANKILSFSFSQIMKQCVHTLYFFMLSLCDFEF